MECLSSFSSIHHGFVAVTGSGAVHAARVYAGAALSGWEVR